mmetsp:Transcript_42755/g.167082  ORF Transcript_42755/g.167082 Transcript_42755/m.167082 type:complete len:343 (+) Transcript_42755:2874-3902(+)
MANRSIPSVLGIVNFFPISDAAYRLLRLRKSLETSLSSWLQTSFRVMILSKELTVWTCPDRSLSFCKASSAFLTVDSRSRLGKTVAGRSMLGSVEVGTRAIQLKCSTGGKNIVRSKVLRRAQLEPLKTRPGENLPPLDFKALKERLVEKFESAQKHGLQISDTDVVSAALYPSVFDDFKHFQQVYSEEVTHLPTNVFVHPMEIGQEFFFSIEEGKRLYVKLLSVSDQLDVSGRRDVYFDLNGVPRLVKIADKEAAKHMNTKPIERIDSLNPAHVGASMPGTVVDIRTSVGKRVEKGEPLVVLSAMKMETVIAAPRAGFVKRIVAEVGNLVANEDLLIELKLD